MDYRRGWGIAADDRVNWLFTAIAVNLVLIVVYNISPKQKRAHLVTGQHMLTAGLERWYIIASFTLGVGVPFVPAILGHFGQDVYYRTWWVKCMRAESNGQLLLRYGASRTPGSLFA